MNCNVSALIIAHQNVLQSTGGGVQVCSREDMASLEAAGFQLRPIPYEFQRGITARLLNRLLPKVTNSPAPPGLFHEVDSDVQETDAKFIFFGMNAFARLSLRLRRAFPDVRQVLLSYGIESIDFCIEQQIRRRTRTENRYRVVAERMLGREILDEV